MTLREEVLNLAEEEKDIEEVFADLFNKYAEKYDVPILRSYLRKV